MESGAVGIGGLSIGALIVALLKWSGSRNISQLDDTLKQLNATVGELNKTVQALREQSIATTKDIGSLQSDVRNLQQRIDGQGTYWQRRFEELLTPKRRR